MHTKIWRPGTDTELDQLFNSLREQMFNSDHKLAENYNPEHFETCTALTITFDNDEPIFCSSILNRSCWPSRAYRIVNRLWKIKPVDYSLNGYSPGTDSMIHSQINWLKENTDCELIFCSREGIAWKNWAKKHMKEQIDVEVTISEHKYLTCPNPTDERCWQYIVYTGNESLLENWQKK